jgi:hypothetical protein
MSSFGGCLDRILKLRQIIGTIFPTGRNWPLPPTQAAYVNAHSSLYFVYGFPADCVLMFSDTCSLYLFTLTFCQCFQKPNSWTYNFVEVSGHNLASSLKWGFCMDFLNHREGGMVSIRFSSFLLYNVQQLNWRNCKRLREFEDRNLKGKLYVEVTVNSKEENSEDFCWDFVQEFSLWSIKIIARCTLYKQNIM